MKTILVYTTIIITSGLFFIEYTNPWYLAFHFLIAFILVILCSEYISTDKDMVNALFPWKS